MKNKCIEKLEQIKNTLLRETSLTDEDQELFKKIEQHIANKAAKNYPLPLDAKNFFSAFKGHEDLLCLITNYEEPLTLYELLEEYDLKTYLFALEQFVDIIDFSVFSELAEEEMLLGEDADIDFEQSKYVDTYLTDFYRFIPLYTGASFNFIYMDLESGRLFTYAQDHSVVLAPSFKDHIDDLILGLKNDHYSIDDDWGCILYPYSWYERKLVQSGKYISEEGVITRIETLK